MKSLVHIRRALALASLVALFAALAPVAPGRAEDAFRYFGSGWGHGLGMSQWGSYGLAKEGWNRAQILTHFYSGTRVAKADAPPTRLRIGLVQSRPRIRLEAEAGDVTLLLGDNRSGDVVATIPSGETWKVRTVGGSYRILDANGDRVGEDVGGTATHLFAVYEDGGARVRVLETGRTYAHGWLELNIYDCQDGGGCELRLINTIPPQPYLYGLAEVPSSWPKAALQAQAIAARTYAFTKAANDQYRNGCNCALYASSYDQVYIGWDRESGPDGDRWVAAVDVTENLVVKYQGETIQAFYMSSSGGYTENNENVWGGTPIPYLRGVCDPGDYTAANPNAVWEVTLTPQEVTDRLGLGIGTVTGFTVTVRGVSGRIVTVTVSGETGSRSISGGTLRSALGLPDDRVWIDRDRQVTGEIREKYDATGCRVGLATSRQVRVAGGMRQSFRAGNIYFKEGVGAHELTGRVLDVYLEQGGPSGGLGFPVTDVFRLANGNSRARFEGGVITCNPDGACWLS